MANTVISPYVNYGKTVMSPSVNYGKYSYISLCELWQIQLYLVMWIMAKTVISPSIDDDLSEDVGIGRQYTKL